MKNKFLIYIFNLCVFCFFSCKEEGKVKRTLPSSPSNIEQVFNDTIGNYATSIVVKQQNSIAYRFENYIETDSLVFSHLNHRIIGMYHEKQTKIKYLVVENYQGKIPDSLDLTELNRLDIDNSFIENDLFGMLRKNKLTQLNISQSFVYDTLVEIESFKNLVKISLHDNYTNFKISGYMPIREILYRDVLDNNNKLDNTSNMKLNFNKLSDLESLYVYCNNCLVDIPNKKLKRLRIKDNLIDTLYDKESR